MVREFKVEQSSLWGRVSHVMDGRFAKMIVFGLANTRGETWWKARIIGTPGWVWGKSSKSIVWGEKMCKRLSKS